MAEYTAIATRAAEAIDAKWSVVTETYDDDRYQIYLHAAVAEIAEVIDAAGMAALVEACKAVADIDNPPAGEPGHVDLAMAIRMARDAVIKATAGGDLLERIPELPITAESAAQDRQTIASLRQQHGIPSASFKPLRARSDS